MILSPKRAGASEEILMVCVECRERHHEDCLGGSWCDCQHQPPPETLRPRSEPTLSWLRQG
jgi:hypothetical protein